MDHARNEASVGLLINSGHILLIKRNEREGDPWSGQIALPGGFVKQGEDRKDAVIREILEETSLSIGPASILSEMAIHHPVSRSTLSVHPFVIKVDDFEGARPGDEVADIRVVSLADLVYREKYIHGRNAYLAGDWVIWGLTYRILTSYFRGDNKETRDE